MPRKPRMVVPGVPCHVIQRGNNRDVCFYSEQDYQFYLECLRSACKRYRVSVHAYVLMTNHVHILMQPDDEFGISRVMQSVGRRYVQYINRTYRRSGTLWEGRYKSSLVNAEEYLLACYRYIELNPVRANMVTHPADYRWTSYRYNGQGEKHEWLRPHPVYLALGLDDKERQACYRSLFDVNMEPGIIDVIRRSAQFSMPLGNDRFKAQIESAVGRKLGQSKRGRPTVREESSVYLK